MTIHCCVCAQSCNHIGGPFFCFQHGGKPADPLRDYSTDQLLAELTRRRANLSFRDRLQSTLKSDAEKLRRIGDG
jgi:hypothetical protein